MINKYSIAKALLNQAKQVSTDNSYLLIREGQKHESNPNETYVEERVVYGGDTSVGLSDASSDFQLGIYQLNIYTPKAEESAKWMGLEIAGVYQTGFHKGLQLTYENQMLRLRNTTIEPMQENDTHYIHILSAVFSVIN
tara:strand:- start:3814 stop:4230 length:417 start_codon:yes stop_codon:yes gene_type:complete